MRETFERDTAFEHRNQEWVTLRLQQLDLKESQERMLKNQPTQERTPIEPYRGISEADTNITRRIANLGNEPTSQDERISKLEARGKEMRKAQAKQRAKFEKQKFSRIKNKLDELRDVEEALQARVYEWR